MTSILPLAAPGPNRPFVARNAELQLIAEKIRPGCEKGDKIPLAVTCFWGAFGLGKSWLLLELERRYRRQVPRSDGAFPTFAARLDLSPTRNPALWTDNGSTHLKRSQLVLELWKQTALQMDASVPELGTSSPEEIAQAFMEQVTRWLAYSTPVFLLDTIDSVIRADEESFFWIEEHLIEPLAITDRVLFVLSSRGELRRWNRYQVKRRVDLVPLKGFEEKETAGQEVKAGPEVSQALYQHAFCHPLATEHLGRILEAAGLDLRTASATQALAALPLDQVHNVLAGVVDYFLETVPADLWRVARALSVLRRVNVDPLRYLAEGMNLVQGTHGEMYYQNLIGQLQSSHLLYWIIDAASYEEDPTVRRLIAHFEELDSARSFEQAHQKALEYYQEHLSKFPESLARYMPEIAYHMMVLERRNALPEKMPPFAKWWEQFLASDLPFAREPWAELAKAWQNDKELCEVMGTVERARLSEQAQRRAMREIAPLERG